MKKVVYVLLGFLLITTMVAGVGCSKAPAAPSANFTTITGTVTGNPITTVGGNSTITITTPSGVQVFPVNPTASTTYAGQTCSLDQFNQYVADNATYNCTIVYDTMLGAVAVYVHNP